MATVFRNSRRVLAALRRCLPLALIGLAAPWLGAADLPLSVGTYRPATQARNDHYTLTVTLAPPAGSRALSAVDLAFAVVDVDDYARFAWDAQGYTLERHRDGVAAVLCRGTAPLPPSLARGGAVEIRCRAHVLEVVGPSGRLARVLNPGLGRGALASRTGPGQAEVAGTSYQRVEPFTFGDDFMRTEEEAADLGLWQPASGQWRLYSVMERIHANPDARIREGREPDASRSPNPFSLSGTGPDGALILTGQAFWSDYEVAVSVRSFQSDVGLVFAARDAETHWLVRWGLHSLGLRPALLELIERRQGQERLLASATVTGRAEAWYRLAVRQCGDDIRVLVDDVEVLRQRDATCRGGRIGLYARGTHETYFDDVSVRSLDSLELDTPALLGADAWQPRSGDWAMDAGSGECRFTGHGQRGWGDATTAVATLGWAAWPAQRFETTVEAAADAAFGLAVGYRDDGSHLRILWQRQDGGRVSVSRVGAGETSLLAETACALPADRPVHLAVDTRDGVLRIQSDDVTRLRLRPSPDAADLAGPVGLVVAGRSPATFSACRLFAEADENWEAPAAVERFADDPYMQGWASTRFAWQRLRPEAAAEDFPQRFVHQGDFYGAFRIRAPVQDRLAFFFGLDEVQPGRGYSLETRVDPDAGTGMITLSRERRTLAQARFVPGPRQVLPGQQMVDEKIGTRPRTPDTESYGTLELHRDGQAIWASIDGHELFCISDPEPLTGRSLGLQVPAPLDFIHIAAERAQVIDELFERAAVDWTPVGQWEVTNRFACDPRWSHMNGSSMGVAALWSKFAFAGDFTLEYYAGMRMRQEEMMEGADRMYYPRVGDINVAMASRPGEIFSGYNLLITAWDPMWTETTSRLYRLDEVLATSDLELVPRGRHRSPKARAIEVDWDPGGRPVHGAWYFVKLRRTGPRLEAWFDNVLVFSAVDPEPLTPERLALWTKHNSIVIARAKISYRQCRRVVDIGAAPPAAATPAPPQAAAPAPLPELRVVTHPGKALEFEDGDDGVTPWNGDQSVEITRVARADQGQALRLENLHGGGDAGVRLPFHGVDLGRDVVLEMDAAVEPGAQVNLYLAWADLPAELAFVPLTGPREEAPNRARLGPADGIPADGRWHPLRWDLGRWARQRFPWRSSYRVAWVMVGMLHEGYLNAGLGGNPAGAIYRLDAIRLHDAGGRAVGVTWGDEAATAWHWRAWLSRQPDAPPPATAEALTAPSVRLEADGTGTWFVHAEQLGGETPRRLPPRPIEVGEAVAIAATTPAPDQPWDGDRVSIVLSEAPGHPDLTHARLTIAGNAVPINAATTTYDPATRRLDMRVLYSGDGLPDQSAVELRFAAADALAGSVSLDSAGRPRPPSHDIDHAWKARLDYASDRRGPTVALTGDLVRRLTFNRGLDDVTLVAPPREARLNTVTGADGSPALELSNHVCGSTFNAAFALGDIPIGRYPRLAFDYRVDGYTQCDLMFQMGGQRLTVGFTDGDDSARLLVGAVPGVVRDGAWHRAEVDLSMVRPRGFQRSFSAPGVVSEFGLGDWVYPSNAPGARVAVDNLEMVPTVGTAARPLELTWAAHDLSGVNAFSYVWDQEPLTEPDDEPETGEARASFTALPSGEAFFHVRARDGAGNWGETTHARFLIDNDPPTPVEIDPAPGAAVAAEKLRVRFAPSLAGLDPAALTLSVQGQAQPARGGAASWDAERGEFTFDLLSYGGLLRGLVEDGTEISVALSASVEALPSVGRCHIGRWGDGGAHAHVWFIARPARMPQTRGTFMALWDDYFPPVPVAVRDANAAAAIRGLVAAYGGHAL